MKHEVDGRREIASRNTAWANIIARKLTGWGITPNQISIMSVFFALAGCLLLTGTVIYPDFINTSLIFCSSPVCSRGYYAICLTEWWL